MPAQPGALESFLKEISLALAPLETELAQDSFVGLCAELGLNFPPELANRNGVADALARSAAAAARLPGAAQQLKDAADAGNAVAIVAAGASCGQFLEEVFRSLRDLASAIENNCDGFEGISRDEASVFARSLPLNLLQFMLLNHMERYFPLGLRVLKLLGVVEYREEAGDPANPAKPTVTRKLFRLDALSALLTSPAVRFRELYRWGENDFDGRQLFSALFEYLFCVGIPAAMNDPDDNSPPSLDLIFLKVRPKTDVAPPGLEAVLGVDIPADSSVSFPFVAPNWMVEMECSGSLESSTRLIIRPPLGITLVPPQGRFEGDLKVRLRGAPPVPFLIFGQTEGSRLTVERIGLGAGLSFVWDNDAAKGGLVLDAQLQGGKLVLTVDGADGFLSSIVPANGFELDFDAGAQWSSDGGFSFNGNAGLEASFSLQSKYGPFLLQTLYLGAQLNPQGARIEAAIDGSAELGPVTATVTRMGIALPIGFGEGNLGVADLQLPAFRPPDGLGLLVEAGPVTGGGFLLYDGANRKYAGIVELSFQGCIALQAIALITTRLPDGSDGFSMLLIITAEFTPPFNLSFGFTLNAVGGLIGINRTMAIEALREGFRNRTLDSIMFPESPVENANRIIRDVGTVFPPADGRFVVGPMIIIGWGTPTLITGELGIFIELPGGRIAILGQLHAALPRLEAPLMELNMDALGWMDLAKNSYSLDATLYDSRILAYTLNGDMAMRLDGGDQPNFILSVGGFHPRFNAPPGLPHLQLLQLSLGRGNNPRITCMSYFAVTSNSTQFGAHVEAYARKGEFSVQGYLGFDTLIIFSPFSFEVDFSAGAALKAGGSTLASVRLYVGLSGPTPWRAKGKASVELLFLSVSVPFDVSWGSREKESLPLIDPAPLLLEAVRQPGNWSALPGPASTIAVAIRRSEETQPPVIVVHPMALLTFRQRVVPLNIKMTRFGNARPAEGNDYFQIWKITGDSEEDEFDIELLQEYFAPAQIEDMPDAEKLSRPAFEKMDAGVKMSTGVIHFQPAVLHSVTYETTLIDEARRSVPLAEAWQLAWQLADAFLAGSPAARSPLRTSGREKYLDRSRPAGVRIDEEGFAIVRTRDLTVMAEEFDGNDGTLTYTEAKRQLDRYLGNNPDQRDELEIVSAYEAAV